MEILPKFRFAKKNVVILYQGWQQHQKGRENWLSPVIQATWEARAEGLYAVERLYTGCAKVNPGGEAPMTRGGQVACCNIIRQSSSPSQRSTQPDPVLNAVIVLKSKMCQKSNKNLFKNDFIIERVKESLALQVTEKTCHRN